MVMGTMTAPVIGTPAQAQVTSRAAGLVCDNDRAHPYTGTYASVRVPKGASCFLRDAVVRGNVMALHGAVNVSIVGTDVGRNIKLTKVRRNVKIGTAGCRLDPPAGNNIMVTRSHNVLICFMTVGNNIAVKRNDGRISLFHNDVRSNINVSRNLRYDRKPGDGHHRRIAAIRLRHNVAGRHIWVVRNAGRGVIHRDNSPRPIT
jgi:hypothetical protein